MALDHSLARVAAATGEGIVRLYGWSPATVSFGRNQRARGAYDPVQLAARGLGVVRRPTGGRSILHDRELTYAVMLPATAGHPRAAYDAVTALLLNALRALGVAAERAPARSPSRPPGATPCFAEPGLGEVVWNGAKLAGSAQWAEGSALLQHGSVLVDDDQSRLATLTSDSDGAVPPPATLRAALGHVPTLEAFAAGWRSALTAASGVAPGPLDADAPEAQPDPPLLRLYHDDAWTWRR